MYEYVGPSRFQFNQRQKDLTQAILTILPEHYRLQNLNTMSAEITPAILNKSVIWILKIRDAHFLMETFSQQFNAGLNIFRVCVRMKKPHKESNNISFNKGCNCSRSIKICSF